MVPQYISPYQHSILVDKSVSRFMEYYFQELFVLLTAFSYGVCQVSASMELVAFP